MVRYISNKAPDDVIIKDNKDLIKTKVHKSHK